MLPLFVSFVTLFCLVTAAPTNTVDEIPQEYKELIPAEVKELLASLSDSDKAVLKDIAENYKDEDTAIATLTKKSPELGSKVEKLHKHVKAKVDSLGTEAKTFATEIIEGTHKVLIAQLAGKKPAVAELKEKIATSTKHYKALSDDAKGELQKQFPKLSEILKSKVN